MMNPNKDELKGTAGNERVKRAWTAPKLKRIGDVSAIVQGGIGKSVITTGDRGDYLKPRGQE